MLFWGNLLSQCTRARAKLEVKSRGRQAEGFDVLFAKALMHCDNNPRQIGLNHDYGMTFLITNMVLEARAVSRATPIVTIRGAP